MSELIDKAVLIAKMYSEAFESDTDMQRWDSGCWIRYKLFEKVVDSTPTVPYGPRWHRVEESPKKYGTYIVCWKDGEKFWWEKADWDEDWCTEEPNWYSYRDSRATIIKPDYWMPIEPPKEDE